MSIKLGDICTFQSGGTPSKGNPEFFNGCIPWITTTSLNGSQIDERDAVEWITEEAIQKSAAKIVPAHSIMVGTRVGVGKVAVNAVNMSTSQDVISLLNIDENAWSKDFLCKFLQGRSAYLNSQARGATIKGIKIDVLANLEVPVFNIRKQKRISDILDKVRLIIKAREQELVNLDDLIKARFVEMFGDPVFNEKKWSTNTVENLCSEIYGGGTPSKAHPEYYTNGTIPWVSSKDMKTDVLYDSQIHINQLGVEHSTAQMVPVNSVIMVIRSGILKHTLPVAINAVPITVNQDLKVFIPGSSVLTRFMAVQFKLLERDILSGVRAVTADNIEFNSLKQRKLIVPPLELQRLFIEFAEQVDKSKFVVQRSLDEAQKLFDSLMQEYFS